jgi:hypothetical protein
MGLGIVFGLVVLVGGLVFAFGLMKDTPVLIAIGLLILAASSIFGVQPDFPIKRRTD